MGEVMFAKAGPQYAVDKENGISLEATSPYSFVYKDQSFKATLSSEPLQNDNGDYSVCLYLSDLEEWDLPCGQAVNDDDKKKIKKNTIEALGTLGMVVEVE